jgi:aminotransferase
MDFDELQAIATKNTKAVIICTPSNPCGKVFSKTELEQLGLFCKKNNLVIITDEIYEYITYDGNHHLSMASLEQFRDRTVTVSGFSKTFSITGWRIGYSIVDAAIAKWIGNANDLIYVCAPAPLQYGVACAIKDIPDSFYAKLKNEYKEKRDLLCACLNGIGLTPYVPNGAYYVLANVSELPGETSKEKAMHILKRAGVAVVPGDAFYSSRRGSNLVRFCFARDIKVIEEASERLKKL